MLKCPECGKPSHVCSECGTPSRCGDMLCSDNECLSMYARRKHALRTIPKRYREGFRWYTPVNASHISGFVDQMKKWAQRFDKKTSTGLYLWGDGGYGKTGVACSILLEVSSRGYSVDYVSAAQLLRLFQATYNGENGSPEQIQNELLDHDLVVVDDLGVAKASAWSAECTQLLFDQVARDMRPVVIVTSNLSLAQEIDRYKGTDADNMMRAAARIAEVTEEIHVSGKNLRELKQ